MQKENKEGFIKTGKIKNKKVFLLVLLVLCFSALIVTFAQPLAKNLFPVKTSSLDWDIKFTKAIQSEVRGFAKSIEPVSYDATSASFAVHLTSIGDSITYDFTVTNAGKIDAKVDSIYIVPTNKEDDAIIFQTSNLTIGETLLAGESKILKVTALFNPDFKQDPHNIEKKATICVNFVQK